MWPRRTYTERVSGVDYYDFLGTLHKALQPRTYVEIGVQTGDALKLADCASIGVDPAFILRVDVKGTKPLCLLFEETSDSFFARHDPTALLGGPIELAFLDGMHQFEFLLRDFINMERHCRPDSLILLHDCLPPHFSMTSRKQASSRWNPAPFRGWWTGDVWKIVPVLRQYRPELSIDLLDCLPTGLAIVTGLDPQSQVLSQAYEEIVARNARRWTDRLRFHRYWASVETASSDLSAEQLQARYPLRPATTP